MKGRFARQVSLAEIGTDGQAKLEASAVRAGSGDARARSVALDYLARAGVRVSDEADVAVDVASAEAIAQIAGRPELLEAAAFLVGALAATERVAKTVGVDVRTVTAPSLSSEP